MKKLSLIALCLTLFMGASFAQSIEDLKAQRDEKAAQQAELQGQADALAGEVASLDDQIVKLSGWQTGLNGLLGLAFAKNDKWQSIANNNSSSAFNVGITAFANKNTDAYFWNNKGILNKAWQDVDKAGESGDDGLFDQENSTADIVNIASLYGFKLSDNFAVSALGELNTSVNDFLKIGTFDIGVGATWTPISNLVVVMHPLNYHYAFGNGGEGAMGAKIRADYTQGITVAGKGMAWSSTFTTFLPYKELDPSLFEWTWLNNLSFSIWNGIGVGVGLGLRGAEFEVAKSNGKADTQLFYTVGLSYGF
ncbi:MAG: DUF3078 domain-containing protein [Bacteroidia bacterium]|nr:DUF3078 domain-containing protein [Bacteroidia bacterium]